MASKYILKWNRKVVVTVKLCIEARKRTLNLENQRKVATAFGI